jgi:hypothetical protein
MTDIFLEFGRRRWEKLIHGYRAKTDEAEQNKLPLLFQSHFYENTSRSDRTGKHTRTVDFPSQELHNFGNQRYFLVCICFIEENEWTMSNDGERT